MMVSKKIVTKVKGLVFINSKGLTIIEILVVFTVISILGGIGFVAFVAYSQQQQVNQTANNLKLLINEAKFNSLSVVKIATNSNGDTLSCDTSRLIGYSVNVVSPTQISLIQVCDEVSPPDRTIKTINLPGGVTIASVDPPDVNCESISFAPLSSTSTGTPCNIKISGFGNEKIITVGDTGNVSIDDL